MIIDNSTAISCMKKDMEYFYYDIVDLKFMSNDITIFSKTLDELMNRNFIRITVYDNEILIDIHTDNISLISEAISFAEEKNISEICISMENDIDISFLSNTFPLEISNNQKHKHWGIFGVIKNAEKINFNDKLTVSKPTQSDIDSISSLPNEEWAFLPQRIKFLKNILIAKDGGNYLGYLVYDSIEPHCYDIVMIYVHPDFRRLGAASTLIKSYATECENKKGVPYYVCANSEGSAKLAKSLNINELRKETIIYKIKKA